jgi:hypothetical protein
MKYLVLAYGDRQVMSKLTPDEFAVIKGEAEAHDAELKKTGKLLDSMSLEWDAVTIRPKGGKTVVTDGPFLETTEQIGGLVKLEARDLNEAVRVASLHPAARMGDGQGWGIELRAYEHEMEKGPHEEGPKWLLLAYGRRDPWEKQTPAEMQAIGAKCVAIDEELRATGKLVDGFGVSWDAMRIVAKGKKPVVTDGPYLETKDLVGGLMLLTAKDRAEAIRLASMHPAARIGEHLGWAVELRPVAAGCHQ